MSSIKKKTSDFVVWIIMLLLVVGLGGFGVSNFGDTTASIATVGDTEVDINTYYRALQQELQGFQAQTGQSLSLPQAVEFGVDQGVRARLITDATLDNETARIGLSVGDERVRRELLANPAFQGIDGNFDRAGYGRALENAGLNEAEYEDTIRVETARTLLQGAIVSGVATPIVMRDAFLSFNYERRNFSWLRLDETNLAEIIPEPTDEQLQTYYDANAAEFTEPEKKRLSYVWVAPDMIVNDITIAENELREEYKKRQAEYSQPERRLVERLNFPDAETAAAAKTRLDAGDATFEDLVADRGLTLLDIDLGDATLEALDEAGDAIFAMDAPGVIGPIDTNLGPALFRMNGILAATETSFEDVRQQLQDELALDRARRQINASITDIDDLLAGGATLQEVADDTDLELAQIDWAAGDSDGIATYSAFREAAGEINTGDYAEVLTLDDGGIFALQMDEVIAPALKPIDTVMIQVIDGWENTEIETQLTKMADDLLTRLSNGEDIASFGYDVASETDILRTGTIEGTPHGFIQTLFEMDKGTAQSIDGSGAVFVVQLNDVLPPDPENPDLPEIKTNLDDNISQSLAQDIFTAFSGVLQAEAGVYVNSAAVNAVHSQFPQ